MDHSVGEGATNMRQAKNFLLQPAIQTRLGLYNVVLSAVFGAALLLLVRAHQERMNGLLELLVTDVPAQVQAAFRESLTSLGVWFALVVLIFVFSSLLASVVFTHRLVGPTYAFRRHLAELTAGNYAARVNLRKDDAFVEVADDLNRLAATLQAAHAVAALPAAAATTPAAPKEPAPTGEPPAAPGA